MSKRGFKLNIIKSMCFICILCVSFTIVSIESIAKTKKMTSYTQVIKTKKYIYCATFNNIYRVNVKTKKVSRLVKDSSNECGITNMKIKNGYLYYYRTLCVGGDIKRVKLSTKKVSYVEKSKYEPLSTYVIDGSKVYYLKWDSKGDNKMTMSKKITGKKATKSSYKLKLTRKKTNAKGYKVVSVDIGDPDDFYAKYYLQTPKGKKIYLSSEHRF